MVSTRAKEEFKNGFISGAQELYDYLRNESESRSFQTELDDLFQSFRQSRSNEWPRPNPNEELQDEDDVISRELNLIQNKRSRSISLSTDPPTPAPSEPETPPPAYVRPRVNTSAPEPTPSPRKKPTKNNRTSTLSQPRPPVSSNNSREPRNNAVAPNAASASKNDQPSPTTSTGTKRKGTSQQDEDQEDEEPVKAKRVHKSYKKIEQEKEMIQDGTLGRISPPTYRSLQVLHQLLQEICKLTPQEKVDQAISILEGSLSPKGSGDDSNIWDWKRLRSAIPSLFAAHAKETSLVRFHFLQTLMLAIVSEPFLKVEAQKHGMIFDGCLKRPAHDSALRVAHFVHFTGTINSILLFATASSFNSCYKLKDNLLNGTMKLASILFTNGIENQGQVQGAKSVFAQVIFDKCETLEPGFTSSLKVMLSTFASTLILLDRKIKLLSETQNDKHSLEKAYFADPKGGESGLLIAGWPVVYPHNYTIARHPPGKQTDFKEERSSFYKGELKDIDREDTLGSLSQLHSSDRTSKTLLEDFPSLTLEDWKAFQRVVKVSDSKLEEFIAQTKAVYQSQRHSLP